MKSLYGRQFLLTAGMILISFALLGTAFIGLSYQYTIRETRDSMERNADYVADFTAKVRAEGIDVRDMAYQLYVANVAHIANAFVLVTEADGELVLCSDGATIQSGLGGNYLPQSIVSQLQKEGGYSGMTTLGGLFPEKRFVAGTPITVKTVNLATGQTEQTMIAWPMWRRRPRTSPSCGRRSSPSFSLPPWWYCAWLSSPVPSPPCG